MLALNRSAAAEVAVGTKYRDAANAFNLERAAQTAGEKDLSKLTYAFDLLEGVVGLHWGGPVEAGREARIQRGAVGRLQQEALRVGITPRQISDATGGFVGGLTSAEEAQNISGLIRQRGGDPNRPYRDDPQLARLIGLMEAQNLLLQQQQQKAAVQATPPPALPGQPNMINRQ
jgi:hypothetical protein